jgi:ribosomal protein S18 acetylase RimI-like enzyme
MIVRQGTIEEMLTLWCKKYTSGFFSDNMQEGNAEFWTIEDNGRLIGELYLFKSLADHDFADGSATAYLCAFRIAENRRGLGLGTMLMNRALDRLRELRFAYATMGVEPGEEGNVRLYTKMGFTEKIKTLCKDPCDMDANNMPVKCPEYMLLRKKL